MTTEHEREDELLRQVALENARAILAARQRAEQQLAESLALMRATLEASTDGIMAVDADGQITHFNQHYLRLWGLTPSILKGHHATLAQGVQHLLKEPAGFLNRLHDIYAAAPAETQDVLELADGRVIERYSRIQIIDGRASGRVWTFRDVTERRRAEEALREETSMLELLNRTGTVLASDLELASVVQTLIDAATQLAGARFGAFFYNVTTVAGDSYQLFALAGAKREDFAKFGQPRATPVFAPTFRGEGVVRCDDVMSDPRYGKVGPHYGMPKGHLPVRSYLAVPVKSRTGEVLGGLFFGHPQPGVFTERSERVIEGLAAQAAVAIDNAHLYERERAARAEAERMGALKDEFLATLSHELRTPLGAILGWAQVLRRRRSSEADVGEGLDAIERNARVQKQLIEDLLDMSRITSGKVRLDIQPVEPAGFIEAAIETVRPSAEAKGIRLQKILDPLAGPISGDPHRLQQVLWNLLSNAIKFTPRDGKVQVILQRVNSHVEISVADSGIGIKREFLQHVFERFRQADASSTRHHGGLGLGLSIVKSLVELHGGSVHVHSDGEGLGATFSVHLPVTAVQRPGMPERLHPAAAAASSPFLPTDLAGLTILVVDDHPDAQRLLQRMLADCGARVLAAGSAVEALGVLEKEPADLLVSDIGMPNVDGFELLRRVRALPAERGGQIKAIALTAFARTEDRTRALRAGFLAHVSKPVDPSELVATIASVLGRVTAV
ncbi:MAG TPA: ATP-binding protein [Burkholderiales bacterium]|nr:ATP-binding protein [Burkholderiales bacterium]